MITNERQYRITQAEAKRFEQALEQAAHEQAPVDVDPRLHEAMIDGLRHQLDDLREELHQYEDLREGKITKRVFTSLLDLPNALIEGRIVRRLTQKELAKRLGLPEQQVQRYEGTRYAGVSLERLQQVADAVGITLKETVEYDSRAPTQRRKRTTAAAQRRRGKASSRTQKGGETMAGRKTGKAAATAAGKTLASKTASKTPKRAAASDLAQVGNQKVTGKAAASAAGKTLASKSASKAAKRAAASDLSQAARKKR
jgi:transcriptional regulator with XRE-family HTH domain